MISEPEMAGEGESAGAVDLVSDTDRPPPLGRFAGRPWAWALGAAVVTSAVWAAVLQGTGYGHTAAPDLHGYGVDAAPCTNLHMQPLADDLGSVSFGQIPPKVTRSAALDRVSCTLIGSAKDADGWSKTYTMAVAVELHKKKDPADEFDALSRSDATTAASTETGLLMSYMKSPERITHPEGLGDEANLIAGDFQQSLYVRHGGAVFSLTLVGSNDWDESRGQAPTGADGGPERQRVADTSAFRKDLVPTMRTLMRAMAQPPSSS
ncbi:hypothetical protein OG900_27720 [Streptomyces sp. NBC_00433]